MGSTPLFWLPRHHFIESSRFPPALNPDFLYAALDATAYAAFVPESRKKRAGATKLHRKSGEARDESGKRNRRSLHYAALRSG